MDAIEYKVAAVLRPEVLTLSAYHVQDASGYIKLDAMENPYTWPDDMVEAWLQVLRTARPNRYPDPSAGRLRAALKSLSAAPLGSEIMLGNGSDELIQIILMAIAGRDATVLAPEPTFVMYRQIAQSLGLRFIGVGLRPTDFSLDMNAMRSAIEAHRPAVIFIAYPNNPTGNSFATGDLLEILSIAPGLVVIDEAYAPFADDTFVRKLSEYPQLLVMRTLSKFGLAGLRLGFLLGHPAWIDQLEKLRLPYNINELTQLTVEFALSRQEVFDDQIAAIRRDREFLMDGLQKLPGVKIYPSQANFITIRLSHLEVADVFSRLQQAGILIKNLHTPGGSLENCLRITVGTPEENTRFLTSFETILMNR